jgi:hypothetical protein
MLSVINQAGGMVTVTINGRSTFSLMDDGQVQLTVPAGKASVKATYKQFGRDYVLESSYTQVYPGTLQQVLLEPETTARVAVSNKMTVSGQLIAEGRVLADLEPGETEIIEYHPGKVSMLLRSSTAVLGQATLDLKPFVDSRWTVEPPPVGDLLVINPLPIPIEVVCDRGMVRTIPAYGRTLYTGLKVGSFHLTARRVSDEPIDDAHSVIRSGAQTIWQVDPPSTGIVALDNQHWAGAQVFIDGVPKASLSPEQDLRLQLSLGWHQLVIKDERGRVVLQEWVEVEAFETPTLAFGRAFHSPAIAAAEPRVPTGSSCSMPH